MKLITERMMMAVFAVMVCIGSGFAETRWVRNNGNTGDGSLRNVLAGAVDGDVIAFDVSVGATNVVLTSVVMVNANVEIDGGGVSAISGYGLRIAADKEVTISNLTFRNCNKGGYGAAVYTYGVCHFHGCSFLNGNTSAFGAAVYNDASRVHFKGCLFSGNSSGGYGGAIYNWKEGSECHVLDCTFKNNRSTGAFGGAIYHQTGRTFVENSYFEGNWADSYGGAIMCDDAVVLNCTFVNNHSGSYGGAIMSDGGVIANCTFKGNYSTTYGGAVIAWDTIVANCTVIGNRTGNNGGGLNVNREGCWSINNVCVGNSAKSWSDISNVLDAHPLYSVFGDLNGTMSSADRATCITGKKIAEVVASTPIETEVRGVKQLYYQPNEDSVALDAGAYIWHSADWSAVAYSVGKDGEKVYMRGTSGADRLLFEDQIGHRFRKPSIGSISVSMFQVYTNADSGKGSLREAIANAEDGETILFDLPVGENEIKLLSPIKIKPNTFADKGITIGGDNGGRCIKLDGGNEVQQLVVCAGNKVFVDGINFANGYGSSGGAICNMGALNIRNCAFTDNHASSWGGAIANMRASTFYADNCDFVGNRCDAWGGAIASHTTAVAILLNSRLYDNSCLAWGGAVVAFGVGDLLVISCNVHDNEAFGGGGIVAQSDARLTLIGTSVHGNAATGGTGPDTYNQGGTINAFGSYSVNNTGAVAGETALRPLPMDYSVLASSGVKALGAWYSQTTNRTTGAVAMQLNQKAAPRFAARAANQPVFEVNEDEYVTMKVENVKPLLYYGLGWSDTPGGEFMVEPGMWIQADANGNLPSDVKAPKGNGSSRFFRVKVTDDPSVAK